MTVKKSGRAGHAVLVVEAQLAGPVGELGPEIPVGQEDFLGPGGVFGILLALVEMRRRSQPSPGGRRASGSRRRFSDRTICARRPGTRRSAARPSRPRPGRRPGIRPGGPGPDSIARSVGAADREAGPPKASVPPKTARTTRSDSFFSMEKGLPGDRVGTGPLSYENSVPGCKARPVAL